MAEPTIQAQMMARAVKDGAFRKELASNPRAVLAQEYDVHIPADVSIRVLEDAPDTFSIVLPAREEAARELTDAELEAVAGGAWKLEITWTLYCIGDN